MNQLTAFKPVSHMGVSAFSASYWDLGSSQWHVIVEFVPSS